MTVPLTRRARISALERLGFAANRALQDLAAVEPAPMPLERAQQARAFMEAGRAVVELAEREILALEGARDWSEDGGA